MRSNLYKPMCICIRDLFNKENVLDDEEMYGYSTLCYDDHIQTPPLKKTFVFSIHVESKYFRSNKYNLYKIQLHWKQ